MKNDEFYFDDSRIVGFENGETDPNSEDVIQTLKMIRERVEAYTPAQKQKFKLSALRAQMHIFVDEQLKEQTGKTAPQFLREFIDAIGVKNKVFAEYLHIKESNLSAILNGNRRINIELAYKLGELFEVRPELWLQVQSKHEMLLFAQENRDKYKKYNWKDLIKRA